jgi:hypothetical protein
VCGDTGGGTPGSSARAKRCSQTSTTKDARLALPLDPPGDELGVMAITSFTYPRAKTSIASLLTTFGERDRVRVERVDRRLSSRSRCRSSIVAPLRSRRADSLPSAERDLITTKDAAASLNISQQRVEQLATDGKLEPASSSSPERRNVFRRADVERLREERGVGRYRRT